jgi:polysaccharide pyruvyl transferase WcaK-like protein
MRISLVGCSGYGNRGDDLLAHMVARYLRGFAHEVNAYNSNLPQNYQVPDLTIVGPGGVVFSPPDLVAHYNCMTWYLKRAEEQKKPWAFMGCGFQWRRHEDKSWLVKHTNSWLPWLKKAKFLSFRSQSCLDHLRRHFPDKEHMHYFPDVGYLAKDFYPSKGGPGTGLVLCPNVGGFSKYKGKDMNPYVWKRMAEELAAGRKVTVVRMGSQGDDQNALRTLRDKASKMKGYNTELFTIANVGVSTAQAINLISRADHVISERFHGYVVAKSFGKPTTLADEPSVYKLCVEDRNLNPEKAKGHFQVLSECLSRL